LNLHLLIVFDIGKEYRQDFPINTFKTYKQTKI
jgi:hypothetical protein